MNNMETSTIATSTSGTSSPALTPEFVDLFCLFAFVFFASALLTRYIIRSMYK